MSEGYVGVLSPDHPRADSAGYVLEHILVAESALGRYLPRPAEVHHVDHDKGNNSNTNLVVCPAAWYHRLLHQRERALDACGNADALRCRVCHGYDRQDELVSFFHDGRQREMVYHRDCHAAHQRELRARRKAS